ncbi:MAG: 1-aminocyclopropane-1-carboxylate deaminase [Crocinitomicaceae bacterium]|jgi:1-aminocyclopropane-1-carboxylate deaminase
MDTQKSIVQEIRTKDWDARGIRVLIKRDDLIHPEVSGNKWRKLKYSIDLCKNLKKDGIITFGGAYSNHLVASAAACNLYGLKSIGLVRGEELNANSNATLKRCAELGMSLIFISREEYALRNDKEYHATLGAEYRSMHLIPEGGANYYGMIGCQEILTEVEESVDHIFVAQGTTTTSCGILLSLAENQKLHVVPVLKGFDSKGEMLQLFTWSGFEMSLVEELLESIVVHPDFHFGGYAKYPVELIEFIQNFYKEHTIKLDPIYTGKTMACMLEQLKGSEYDGTTSLFIHTGGLQGAKGIVSFE